MVVCRRWYEDRFVAGLAILILAVSSTANGQISLKPDIPADYQSPEDLSSRRERGVSRNILPLPAPDAAPIFEPASRSTTSNRDQEFALISREADALERQLRLIRRIVKFSSPSIVHIEASKKSAAGKGFAASRVDEAGAGVIVDLQGQLFVLTNRHVIHPAELNAIRIELTDGQRMYPTAVWTDPSTDVAVLKLNETGLVPARLGNSDSMDIGDFVLAVGSPFGLSHSVTYGILSAKGRRNLELGSKEIEVQDFFQTDAAINPGNSGGPLLNLRGEVIAINTAIASNSGGNEGIGFSIPINMAMVVADQLVRQGSMRRSYLGVQLENGFDVDQAKKMGLQAGRGALVKSVLQNSPAEKAGIRVGDVILEFNGRPIENDGHLVKLVSLTPTGSQVEVSILRDGRPIRLTALLHASPE